MSEKNYVATPLQVFEHGSGPVVPEAAESPKWPNFPEDDDTPPQADDSDDEESVEGV